MSSAVRHREYDLEERTVVFADRVRIFLRKIPRTLSNGEDGRQLIKSSGSVGANYIEANEALGKLDFMMKIKTSKREARESVYWLRLINVGMSLSLEKERAELMSEARQFTFILGAILRNIRKK